MIRRSGRGNGRARPSYLLAVAFRPRGDGCADASALKGAEQVQQRAEEEARLREDEVKRRESAERELVEPREELARLKAFR